MALTKVSGGILDPGINVAGIVTATGFDGPFVGGTSDSINAGIITATGLDVNGNGDISGSLTVGSGGLDLNGNGDISGNLVVHGNLTANGDFTTLNTTLREVELLRVDANSSVAAGIITQTGAGDLLRLYDGTSQVVTVDDEGNIGIGRATPTVELDVIGSGKFIKTSNNYILVGSSNAGGAAIVLDGDSNGDGSGSDYAYIEHDSSGNLNIVATNPSDNSQMVFNTGDGSEVLRIKADGKLGINYNSPVTIIHALGNSNVGTSVTMTLQSHDTANATAGINLMARRNDNVNETCKIQAASGGQNSVDLQFHTNSGEKLRITSDGNIGFNRDSVNAGDSETETATSTPKRIVFNNDYSNVETDAALKIYLFNNNATRQGFTSGANFNVQYHSSGNSASKHTFYTQNTERVRIDSHITAAAGVDLNLDSTLGSNSSTAYSGFDGRLVFDTSYSDAARGPNKIQLQNSSNTWIGGFGISANTLDIYTGGTTAFRRSSGTNTYTTQMSLDYLGNLSPSGDVRLTSSAGDNSSTAVTDAAWSRLEFDQDYSDTARGPNKILLTPFNNWKGGFGISSNSLDVYTGGIIHFYGKTNTDDASNKETLAKFITDGACELYYNNAIVLRTQVNHLEVIGNTSETNIEFLTNPNSPSVRGLIGVTNNGTMSFYTNDGTQRMAVQLVPNGAVLLKHGTSTKFATSETGIDVTGEVAASQDYPNFRPTIDFNFAAQKKLDPRITYQRTGVASFVNEFGKVVLVGDNAPRFDHDPDTGECKGLLIEESRTNIAPYTDLSEFSGHNITKIANNAVAPDGTTTAAKIEHGGSGTSYLDHINTSINAQNAGPYTYSVWLKAPDDQPDGYYGCRIAVLHSTGGNVEPTVSLNKTWTRYTVTKTFGASDGGNLRVHPIMFRASPGSTYDGKVIPSYVWAWGAQIEAGAFSTSYIPDAGATRGYEAVTLEGTDFSDVFGTEFNEFSLVADYDNTQTDDGTQYGIIDLWGESTGYDDRVEWMKDNASPYHIETRSFGQGNATFANGNLSASNKTKSQRFATSWYVPDYSNTSSRRFVVSMGGEAVDVIGDGSGTTVPQITRMGIGCNPTRLDFSPGLLHFKRLMVYNKTLSDGQLQNLSAQ